ncbi:uncharacterized protein LOC112690666 [Sipha flava]|jgi:hypothetical protein|uniref:Uncharacterized protein LOC112690666 n=1 Tax=Sipha flava TaxID=143950 RepID=A0A8B8GC49_9HEMI|nr:uncharacterized protein LOC112690666 [Sipha flava]
MILMMIIPELNKLQQNFLLPFLLYRKKKKRKAIDRQNDFLKLCSEALSKDDIDEYDAIGINVASKLKRMDPTQSIHADLLINKVLTQGLLGNLTSEFDICNKSTVQQHFENQNLSQIPTNFSNYSYNYDRPTSNSTTISSPSPSIQDNINTISIEKYPTSYIQ